MDNMIYVNLAGNPLMGREKTLEAYPVELIQKVRRYDKKNGELANTIIFFKRKLKPASVMEEYDVVLGMIREVQQRLNN